MPINKNAQLRYKILDRCFMNTGRSYSFEDLLNKVNEALVADNPKHVGVKPRQLRDDIRFMRSEAGYDSPIETKIYDGKKHVYFYSDPTFSINNSPLNETEAKQLKNALHLFQRFSGSPAFEWVEGLNIVLKEKFGGNEEKVISFETNLDYTGYQWISILFNFIIQKKVINILYTPFDREPFMITFHPYYLKQYNNRWFVFGLNVLLDIPTWTLALDRIEDISELNHPYHPSDIDWEYYLSDIIGVTRLKGDLEEVKLLFSPKRSKYIETKPLHESQRTIKTSDGLVVRLLLVPNPELEQVILSFGEDIQVLEPSSLVTRIKERIESMSGRYNN